jgi:hypothetical protein
MMDQRKMLRFAASATLGLALLPANAIFARCGERGRSAARPQNVEAHRRIEQVAIAFVGPIVRDA